MSDERPKFLLAGGGTGGHLFPALAIADKLRQARPDAEILFVGTKQKIEGRVVPEHGYAFKGIWISGFHRSLRPGNLAFPLKVVISVLQSFFVIRRFRPHVVIGTGGYVCGPVLLVASWFKIPTILHESNSYPGATTRLLAGRMSKVFLGFEHARAWLNAGTRSQVVGTPTRETLGTASKTDALRFFALKPELKTVLVVGGSQGAASINEAISRSVEALTRSGIQILWQTGNAEFEKVKRTLGSRSIGWIGPFIERMDLAYAVADLVVCRSGATTLAELTRVGKPAILIPFPHAAEDHQTYNARTLADAGAAVMIQDSEIGRELQGKILEIFADSERQRRMAAASKALGKPDAADEIARNILALINL